LYTQIEGADAAGAPPADFLIALEETGTAVSVLRGL
jgi:hypothetical protein